MKRTLLFALTVLANSVLASANPITKGQALNIASKYISNPTLSNKTPKTRSLKANELIIFSPALTMISSLLYQEKAS